MSRLRILVESDGETIVDIDDDVEHWAVGRQSNAVEITPTGEWKEYAETGERQVKIDYRVASKRKPKPERIAL